MYSLGWLYQRCQASTNIKLLVCCQWCKEDDSLEFSSTDRLTSFRTHHNRNNGERVHLHDLFQKRRRLYICRYIFWRCLWLPCQNKDACFQPKSMCTRSKNYKRRQLKSVDCRILKYVYFFIDSEKTFTHWRGLRYNLGK